MSGVGLEQTRRAHAEPPAGIAHLAPRYLFSGSIHAAETETESEEAEAELGLGLLQWREITTPLKLFTNVFVIDEQRKKQLLLGWKKRGFGKDMYNGFGGKVEEGETPLECAHRELEEEAGVKADLKEIGILLFVNAHTDYCHYVHMYTAQGCQDQPIESDEMRPSWFAVPPKYHTPSQHKHTLETPEENLPSIPYETMWPDDEFWMPLLLAGTYFVGRMDFEMLDQDKRIGSWEMVRWWFGTKLGDETPERDDEGRTVPPTPEFIKERR